MFYAHHDFGDVSNSFGQYFEFHAALDVSDFVENRFELEHARDLIFAVLDPFEVVEKGLRALFNEQTPEEPDKRLSEEFGSHQSVVLLEDSKERIANILNISDWQVVQSQPWT